MSHKSRAFTLVEMLVVVAIIGILVGILVPTVSMAIKQGEDGRARARVQEIALGCQAYYGIYSYYPGQQFPDVLKGNNGPKNGTQVLAEGLNMTGTGTPLVAMRDGDVRKIVGTASPYATVDNCISDRNSSPLAILYYPARTDPDETKQYRSPSGIGPQNDNSDFWMLPQNVSDSSQFPLRNISPGAFILVAAGMSRSYTAGDLIQYPGK